MFHQESITKHPPLLEESRSKKIGSLQMESPVKALIVVIPTMSMLLHKIFAIVKARKDPKTVKRFMGSKSSLREANRTVHVVTTAALPWLTGTSVNALFRAAYLARQDPTRSVTLVVPWMTLEDQRLVFHNKISFDTQAQQEAYIRDWLSARINFAASFSIIFYPGKYDRDFMSIIPRGAGPLTAGPDRSLRGDVAVLEEPEHLNWFTTSDRWVRRFTHVVGVAHTNYVQYALNERGPLKSYFLKTYNVWCCAIHCHKVIKLSDAVQTLPRQVTMFVHGVGERFLQRGDQVRDDRQLEGGACGSKGIYFLAKAVWSKGYRELLELVHFYDESKQASQDSRASTLSMYTNLGSINRALKAAGPAAQQKAHSDTKVHIDVFGSGDDLEEIKKAATKLEVDCEFHGSMDHLDPHLSQYRVFVNPCLTDVVATTTAEALAMGKWVVVAHHPENYFFFPFHNTLVYKTPEEFVVCINHALNNVPAPLTDDERHSLTWEAATERFLDAAEISLDEWPKGLKSVRDSALSIFVLTCLRTGMPAVGVMANTARIFLPGKENSILRFWRFIARKNKC